MKVSLGILDRVLILSCLPAEDNIITLRAIRNLKKQLGFTEDELTSLDLRVVDAEKGKQTIQWNQNKIGEVEFDLHPKAQEIIASQLKKMNTEKKLTEGHIDLYDKIVTSFEKE